MSALIRRGAIVSSVAAAVAAAIVSAAAQQPPTRVVTLPGRLDSAPYADAVVAGDTVYLAGRLGLNVSNAPPADPAEEVRLILDGMKTVLTHAGLTMDDLVSVEVYCADVSLLDTFNAVYRRYFTKGFPARAFIGSGPLLFGARFEVKGIAVKSR
jgi:2-iminobutanoate/2-iminopropanoate deaminase